MRRNILGLGILGCALLIAACSSTATFTAYERDIATGKVELTEGDYPQARNDFLKASQTERRPEALALAATASYKLDDLKATAEYLAEAERSGRAGSSYFRIAGYKALLFFKEGKKEEGLKVLGDYIRSYRSVFDSDTLPYVEYMWKKGTVDLPRLERLIDRQVTEYEQALDWYNKTRTGPFDKNTWRS